MSLLYSWTRRSVNNYLGGPDGGKSCKIYYHVAAEAQMQRSE